MAIGIDDLDYDEPLNEENTTTQNIEDSYQNDEEISNSNYVDDRDIISEYLKQRGVSDISKIKYEGDDGEETERNWDTLDAEEKLQILNQLDTGNDVGLDDNEIQLVNAIRNSNMTPSEYLNYIGSTAVSNYAQNLQASQMPEYTVNQYSDDELFVADMLSKLGRDNVTNDEINEALDKAKSNMDLYKKQVEVIRKEYQQKEDIKAQQEQYLEQKEAQEAYNQFAGAIYHQINDLNELRGFELNMTDDDKDELFQFLTGYDGAGISNFSKALNDPEVVTRMAWFALHGDQMMDDVSQYLTQQIAKVRKDSYQKGVADAQSGNIKDQFNKPVAVYRPKKQNRQSLSIDELD